MDWFSWLSKTSLDASLVHDYALIFTYNQLQEEDISYFNHEFLQSMGISIAKHRLEILKLARKHKVRSSPPILWLLIAMKTAKKFLAKSVQCQKESTLAQMQPRSYSWRWRAAMLRRSRLLGKQHRPVLPSRSNPPRESPQPVLMLTYGSPLSRSDSFKNNFSSPMTPELFPNKKMEGDEEIRWENMFEDLKPT